MPISGRGCVSRLARGSDRVGPPSGRDSASLGGRPSTEGVVRGRRMKWSCGGSWFIAPTGSGTTSPTTAHLLPSNYPRTTPYLTP